MLKWGDGFARDVHLDHPPDRERILHLIQSGSRFVWRDGDLVSMAGATGATPNGIRINSVYTPDEHRRHGYASALVAALSQRQLDAGRRFCFLFTDLANPTSNSIYQRIGYQPVSVFGEYSFLPEG
jgi:predicted GNAT family acetyltransferase